MWRRKTSIHVQWNPDFLNLQGKRKLVRKIGYFEKLGVKLQCSTEEMEMTFGLSYWGFEKMRVRKIGIPLYYTKQFIKHQISFFTNLGW